MAEGKFWLPASGRYRLEILSRGARIYHPQDRQIRALARRGLIEPVHAPAPDGTQSWTITEAGRRALTSDADVVGTTEACAPHGPDQRKPRTAISSGACAAADWRARMVARSTGR